MTASSKGKAEVVSFKSTSWCFNCVKSPRTPLLRTHAESSVTSNAVVHRRVAADAHARVLEAVPAVLTVADARSYER